MADDDEYPRSRYRDDRDRDDDDRPRRRRDEEGDDDGDRPRRRRGAGDDYDDRRPPKEGSSGLAMAGLILGLLSFCTAGLSGIPGGICSLLALGKPNGRGMAIGGLLASGLGILVWVGIGIGAVALMKPIRERVKDTHNLMQLGLAAHNDQDANTGFAGPYARNGMGGTNDKLSFRVGLLPYLEQNSLHKQFDLSQPWNSPKNQPASNTKLAVFTAPHLSEPSASTPYRVFYGGGALFNEDGKPVPLVAVTDGTSNTIMIVHAAEHVPWAEPREFRYSDRTPLPKLGPPDGYGATVLMADGSVRPIKPNTSERTLRNMITRAGGEPIIDD
ncbi:hypothetical protein GobsT_69590 [Gemmata obscuriglobus]|uniref:DUF1559 domain-containing protein n=1 Tax=Gemmata obscuriglobus TaxID=114 RepID=A0A2Z3HJA6_9BACT|nr:DUF1559 domain-containing protein [Gemmata obscuriglobus]AWM41914.1 DUF1559 domain-containing protein [Gemmata obscuriglobus]QEG32108.1 hypothetical protein GobsT_69590 [Gemmata obscuriglobus]VTS11461.1 Uncharacterized protein OS=Singulisphaera acidiphila (strain ATCC BAA-1392 / DSM 18658 / VKM B-2454 / MOB10) GN=Sinac_3477 PE=4 SV=1: SBP_bac_10 [Gemmata obscuriglobus UQM 2246]